MLLHLCFAGWIGHFFLTEASEEVALVNYADDIAVMLMVKSLTKVGLQDEVEQATADLMDGVLTMVSKDRRDMIELLHQDAPLTKDTQADTLVLERVASLQRKVASTNVTYDDLGKGYCRPHTNYYGKLGLEASACRAQCDLDAACIAYNFRAADGGCGIWAPTATTAPSGWEYYAKKGHGENATTFTHTAITHTNNNAQAYCMKKQATSKINETSSGGESVLFGFADFGTTISFTEGMAFSGVVCAVILLILLICYCCSHVATTVFEPGINRREELYGNAPIEIWEKRKVERSQFLKNIFERLDEMEQTVESPPGLINAKNLENAFFDAELNNALTRLGITESEFKRIFKDLDRKGTGFVNIDEFVNGLLQPRPANRAQRPRSWSLMR